jgi:hypothetical protein
MRCASCVLPIALIVLVLASPELAHAAPQGDPEPLPPSGQRPDPLQVARPAQEPPPSPPPSPPVMKTPAPEPPAPPVDEPRPEGFAEGTHLEFTMGFLAGQRSYSKTSFEFEEGTAEGIGGGGLIEPFVKPPFDTATVLGLRYDLRLVVSYIRMTVGLDLPFPTFKSSDSKAIYDVTGTQRTVTVQSLSAKELRFGIGGEYPYKSVACYADLLGGVHWVDTDLAIDGLKAQYGAVNFAFSGRAGVRAHVRSWFFATASGEVGIIGDTRWNAELGVGFSIK